MSKQSAPDTGKKVAGFRRAVFDSWKRVGCCRNIIPDIEKKITEISLQDYIAAPFSFRWFLIALSNIYGLVTSLRLWLYKKNIIKAKKAPCFVISIGNVVAGGSGKTPMTVYIADMLKEKGFYPVVVSRGYGGSLEKGDEAVVAGDGNIIFLGPEEVGDEPFMMAARCSFPVVVGKDRFKGIMKALALLENQDVAGGALGGVGSGRSGHVMILDDGFQHIRVKRDLNILLMDCRRPLGNGRLLPAGRLREGPKGIKRADVTIFTRCSHAMSSPKPLTGVGDKETDSRLENPAIKKNFMTFHHPCLHLFIQGKGKKLPQGEQPLSNQSIPKYHTLETLTTRRAVLFSGIADNSSFRETVENLGICVLEHLEFNDHHMYKSEDIFQVFEKYDVCGADLLLTTEKDYARLNRQKEWPMDLAVMGIEINFFDPREKEEFNAFILNRIKFQT